MERKTKPEKPRTLANPEALINEFLEAASNGMKCGCIKNNFTL